MAFSTIWKFFFLLLSFSMLSYVVSNKSTGTVVPTYKVDEEEEKRLNEILKGQPDLYQSYKTAKDSISGWITGKVGEYKNDNVDQEDLKLGKQYSLKDFFVKKTCEQDLEVVGGAIDITYSPIDVKERKKFMKNYRSVHLDGIYINCQSYMPPNSEGIATFSLYDDRFLLPEKGFLGLIAFPLGKKVTSASMKIDYSISTSDSINWIGILNVYDHNLKDNTRPCNIHVKTLYKYTNNLSRFFNEDETDNEKVGRIKIVTGVKDGVFAQESIRNALDYSANVLSNKVFMKKLSEKEMRVLQRSKSSTSYRVVPNIGELMEKNPLVDDRDQLIEKLMREKLFLEKRINFENPNSTKQVQQNDDFVESSEASTSNSVRRIKI